MLPSLFIFVLYLCPLDMTWAWVWDLCWILLTKTGHFIKLDKPVCSFDFQSLRWLRVQVFGYRVIEGVVVLFHGSGY